jgi:hypothetical protein
MTSTELIIAKVNESAPEDPPDDADTKSPLNFPRATQNPPLPALTYCSTPRDFLGSLYIALYGMYP